MKNFIQPMAYAAVLLLCSTGHVFAELPHISDARIVQPPPGAKVAAAYFKINNVNEEALVITGASSSTIPMVGLHLSSIENDVAKMEEQDSITVAAGKSLEFKHGSFHLMLMGLKENLTPGSMIDITLQTNSGELPLQFPVITPDEASSMMSHEHHGSKKVKKHQHKTNGAKMELMENDVMPMPKSDSN